MKEEKIILKTPEHIENWVLWQIEDRLAQRRSPVFCSPSRATMIKQFEEVKEKQKAKLGELACYFIAEYDKGEIVIFKETLE